jgi:molecular chaperone GrpE
MLKAIIAVAFVAVVVGASAQLWAVSDDDDHEALALAVAAAIEPDLAHDGVWIVTVTADGQATEVVTADGAATRVPEGVPQGLVSAGAERAVTADGWAAAPVGPRGIGFEVALAAPSGGDDGSLLVSVAAAAAVVLGAATWALFARPVKAVPVTAAAPMPTTAVQVRPSGVSPAPTQSAPAAGELDAGTRELVERVIEVRDLTSPALATRLGLGLAALGYETIDPTGERFDPSRHRAVEAAAPADGAQSGTIAVTERVGYFRHEVLVRPADVVVYGEPE